MITTLKELILYSKKYNLIFKKYFHNFFLLGLKKKVENKLEMENLEKKLGLEEDQLQLKRS